MKSPEYVATVTRIYRKYIDLALSNSTYEIDEKDIKDLLQVFNRGGFSNGHLDCNANKDLVFDKGPGNTGIYIGNISNLKPNKGHVLVQLDDCLSIGDTICFEKESSKYTVSELMIKNKNIITANKKQLVEIGRMKGNLHIGDKIYKVASKELSTFSTLSYQKENKKIDLNISVIVKRNTPISIEISTIKSNNPLFNDINLTINSTLVPVEAKSLPISEERIISQINKTSDTIFNFKNINVILDDNLFIPSIKDLNELRRNALNEVLYTAENRVLRHLPINLEDIDFTISKNNVNLKHKKQISVLLNILDENKEYNSLKNIDNLYIPLKYFSNKNCFNVLKSLCESFNVYIYLPTIIKANYTNLLKNIIDNSIYDFNIKGFVISNLSNIKLIEEIKEKYGNKYIFIGNYTLNIFNSLSEKEWSNLNISKLTISPELNKQTVDSILENSVIEEEIIVYGRIPLMNMNYCLLGKTNKCYPNCGTHCLEKDKEYYLKDRMGFSFRIIPDNIQTITTLYNSKITSINGNEFNVSSYRVDIIDESIDEINSIINSIISNNRLEGKDYTNGNLNKEI